MKKIVSMLMVFVAVMAFSGLTTASPVNAYSIKDAGSKTVTGTMNIYGDLKKYHHWYLIYYSKNHVKFYFSTQVREINGYMFSKFNDGVIRENYLLKTGGWYTFSTVTYICDYKRVSNHRIKMTVTRYVNGIKNSSSHKYFKTSKTPYQKFKSQKTAKINYFMSVPYE